MNEPFKAPWDRCRMVMTGARPAAFNMACDEYLMHKCVQESGTAYVRAYRWMPAAFTVGYSQRAGEELDLPACYRDGFDVVRRPTGGRVVLHRDEIAYTVACPNVALPQRGTLSRYIGGMLVRVLAELGCRAELVETGAPPRFMKNVPSVCFTHASATEVMASGRKIMGRSLREKNGVRLEQGFLLLDDGYLSLPGYVRNRSGADNDAMVRDIRSKAVSLREATGVTVGQDGALDAFIRGTRDYFKNTCASYTLTETDTEAISALIKEKYGNPAWTERR